MKVFKTILWTSLFWILVIAGLWVASIFYPQEAKTVIHQNVKNAIIENANIECAIANWEQEPVKIEEEVAPVEEVTPVEEITPVEEEIIEVTEEETKTPDEMIEETVSEKTTKNSILPQAKQTNEDYTELEKRITELETQYNALVKELQDIFSTPLFSQLLSQAYSQPVIGTDTEE